MNLTEDGSQVSAIKYHLVFAKLILIQMLL